MPTPDANVSHDFRFMGYIPTNGWLYSANDDVERINISGGSASAYNPGDSGGSMWGSYMAIALISVGQNSADGRTCNTWGSYAEYAENDLQVNISVSS